MTRRKLSELAKIDRPREKLQTKGAAALSDFELLQALIGSGNKQVDVSKITKDTLVLIKKYGAAITYEQLQQVTGMGAAKNQILVVPEDVYPTKRD